MLKSLAETSIAVTVMVPMIASGASFDCAKASTPQEKIICANVELSNADERLAKTYKLVLASTRDKAVLKLQQKEWLKKRNAVTDAVNMLQLYKERTAQLAAYDTNAVNSKPLQAESPSSGFWLESQSALIQIGVWDKDRRARAFDAKFIVTGPDGAKYISMKRAESGLDWVNATFPDDFGEYPTTDDKYVKYSWKCFIENEPVGGGEFYWGDGKASSNIYNP